MKSSKRNIPAILINLFIFISELIIVITSIPTAHAYVFRYYTFISNLMGMAAGLVFLISSFSGSGRLTMAKTLLRYYATCMLTLTFIVVLAALTPMAMSVQMDPSFLYIEGSAAFHHVIHPVLSFISFVFFEDNRTLEKKQTVVMLGITACYATVLITLNIFRIVDGPYPFFQVHTFPLWFIILWIAGLTGFHYLINYLIYRCGTRSRKNRRMKTT